MSPAPLVRRLAVQAYSGSEFASADEQLQWVLDSDLLYESSVKPEVFRLLQAAYPKAFGDPSVGSWSRPERAG
jgi:hypothetical protein